MLYIGRLNGTISLERQKNMNDVRDLTKRTNHMTEAKSEIVPEEAVPEVAVAE